MKILSIAMALGLLSGALAGHVVEARAAGPLSLTTVQRPLDPERPQLDRVGDLGFRGALDMTSDRRDFAGLSGLEIDARGQRLMAVTDEGRWLAAEPLYDDRGWLAGLASAQFGRLRDEKGALLEGKEWQDAESIAMLPDGSCLVSFEHEHRIRRYSGAPLPLDEKATVWPTPPGLDMLSENKGVEAMTGLGDGRVLAIAESELAPDRFPAWLWQDGAWQSLSYRAQAGYRPSGAALLPDGDLLVLERRFSWIGGLGARLVRVAVRDIGAGAMLEGKELAVLQPPLLTDNWEGVATVRGPGGEILIFLLSDDNFLPIQRNLLALFVLLE